MYSGDDIMINGRAIPWQMPFIGSERGMLGFQITSDLP